MWSPDKYTRWTQTILHNLESAGSVGSRTADYIFKNSVKIFTINNTATNMWWRPKFGVKGLQIRNTLYVSKFIADKEANDPWALMLFVHETRHLEQGFRKAFSVYGELEAWQVGYNFYKTLPDHGYIRQFVEELLKIPLSHDKGALREAKNLINLDQNGGMSFMYEAKSVIKKERSFNDVYWINALPLNPLFSKKESPLQPRI
jgi:hypothetical protein